METWAQEAEEASKDSGKARLSGRIHILGMGNAALFVAHSLARRPSVPPITLMMHSPAVYHSWKDARQSISLQANGLEDIRTGFDVNVLENKTWYSIPYEADEVDEAEDRPPEPEFADVSLEGEFELEETLKSEHDDREIECLIVAGPASMTVAAVDSVKDRLTPDSTVLILSNGMGLLEEINDKIFPDSKTRPCYMQGLVTHDIHRRKRGYQFDHVDVGSTILGFPLEAGLSQAEAEKMHSGLWPPTAKYLLHTLTNTAPLVATAASPTDLLLHQLEKLAIQCVLLPLTALMQVKNGDILYNYSITRVMRLLLLEISSVICALPEIQSVPGVEARFSPERLRRMVTQLADRTADETSTMSQDVHHRRTTEIEYLNGYIVRRGEELGLSPAMNYMIKHLILGKSYEIKQREASAIPIDVPTAQTPRMFPAFRKNSEDFKNSE
ncbi:putative 2-dehydropantoate 2-reductase [Aspergillus homomorphus CBS 101889]|uniref:Putative 2-dehydropantoate 2-reductase n=1 Tax=Aspergillus homomorphus (strain CBS 101889) TaxID=1450537 RepID=A0A395HT18_ASPHC|nr:putative 2-dehydropantoate 2-reductase [Aspergillus homomorphus CBS 101889]RAL10563.1 putative 2-dehydropantoate 2-reductase [Aspergillus homomorphus CBS 101889]